MCMQGSDYRFGTSELRPDTSRVTVPQQLEAVGRWCRTSLKA
jgi:hypothetical protein